MADKLREKIARCLYETHHGQTIGVPEWASIWLPAPVAEDWRRKVDAILSLLREEGVDLEGWRPIESAPKDGTPIIVWCAHQLAKYCEDPAREGYEAPAIARWIDHNGGGWTWHGLAGGPTLWMHLPTPPKDTSNG